MCRRSQYSLQWKAEKDLKRQQGLGLITLGAQGGAGTGAAAAAAAVVAPVALAALQRPDRAAGPGPTRPAEAHLTGEDCCSLLTSSDGKALCVCNVSSSVEEVCASLMRAHTDSDALALQAEQVSSTKLKESGTLQVAIKEVAIINI